jgi:hypothetical protein
MPKYAFSTAAGKVLTADNPDLVDKDYERRHDLPEAIGLRKKVCIGRNLGSGAEP